MVTKHLWVTIQSDRPIHCRSFDKADLVEKTNFEHQALALYIDITCGVSALY